MVKINGYVSGKPGGMQNWLLRSLKYWLAAASTVETSVWMK